MNPSIDLTIQEGENSPVQIYCGRKRRALVRFRLMQRPVLMKLSKVAGGDGALELGRHEEEEGTEGEKEKRALGLYLSKKG